MRKAIFVVCIMLSGLIAISQNKNNDLQIQDTVIINGGWRSKYLENPIYIKNKNYVVFQYLNTRKIIYPDMQSFRIIQDNRDCAIAVDKNGVYYQGIFMKADTAEIKVVGERYVDREGYQYLWKNREKVFRDTIEVEGIDANTFQPIECFNGSYFKDKNYVYYFDKKIEGSDGATVNKSCYETCYDKNQTYIKGEIGVYNGEKLHPINSVFAKTNTQVINSSTMQPVENIDATSIVKLSDRYSKDKNHVYYGITKLPIKKENLQNVRVWEQVNRAFVTDGINIYSGDGEYEAPEKELDAETFGMLPHSDFTYDKNGFYERKWVEEKKKIILEKFPFKYTEPITPQNMFFTDNNMYVIYLDQAYNPWDKVLYTNLSPQEIQLVKNGALLPIDKNNYTAGSLNLKPLGYNYSKKENAIFYNDQQLSGIQDVESFKPLSYVYAKDNQYVYMLEADYDSTKKENKYTLNIIENADPNTFEINVLAFDKNRVYLGSKSLINSKDIELLAIFSGYRPGCGSDRTPSSNYILMKNKDGFWFLETTYSFDTKNNLQYLGKTFKPTWNKVFEDFELAK